MRVRFGGFTFDSETRELLRGGEPVPLAPKAFQLLEVLLRKRPQALSKEDLKALIWPGIHVSEASLSGLVAELRTVLGDPARQPALIRTVHGFGYAFSGAVAKAAPGSEPAAMTYRLVWGRREIELAEGENVLGRDSGVAVWLDSPSVSRRHARITVSPKGAVLEDLGSRNGTRLRGERIHAPMPLADQDEIRLGSVGMTFRALAASETEEEPED